MKILTPLLFCLGVIVICYAFARAWRSPIVFMTDTKEVCGCLVDQDGIPSKKQCEKMDFNALHEVIWVSKCQ